jgi:DNA-binding NtrC family response regulator
MHLSNKQIVLIQSDPFLAETRRRILEARGYVVQVVDSVHQARNVAHKFDCDLVIVDADKSHDTALELCEEIKKNNPGLNVALMVRYHVYLKSECPDEVIRQEEGPEGFMRKVDDLLSPTV